MYLIDHVVVRTLGSDSTAIDPAALELQAKWERHVPALRHGRAASLMLLLQLSTDPVLMHLHAAFCWLARRSHHGSHDMVETDPLPGGGSRARRHTLHSD